MSVARTIARNTLFNAAGRAWEAVVGLVLTPYILYRVGLPAWGLWGLTGAFTSYISLADFGLSSGFAKFIAEDHAKGDIQGISRTVSTGFVFYLLTGLVVIAAGWPCVGPALNLLLASLPPSAFGPPDEAMISDARFLLIGCLFLWALSNCTSTFGAVQTGLQRMGITNAISFGASMVKVVTTVAFLELGMGVRGLLWSSFAVLAFFGVCSIISASQICPGIRITFGNVTWETFRRLFAFGWRAQVSKLSNLIMFQTDRVIAGWYFSSLVPVGFYRLGEELAYKMRQVPAMLVSALMPAASSLDAREEHERLRKLYLVSSKYVAVASVPLAVYCIFAANPLMRCWIGDGFGGTRYAVWILRILSLGYIANILPGAGVSLALGRGRPDIQMNAGLIATISNILLTIACVYLFGFYGIAIGTAASMFLSCAWFMWVMRKVVDVGIAELLRVSTLWPVLACIPGALACVGVDWYCGDLVGRLANGGLLAVTSVIFGLCYVAILLNAPFLDDFDVRFLSTTLKLNRVPGFTAILRRFGHNLARDEKS